MASGTSACFLLGTGLCSTFPWHSMSRSFARQCTSIRVDSVVGVFTVTEDIGQRCKGSAANATLRKRKAMLDIDEPRRWIVQEDGIA